MDSQEEQSGHVTTIEEYLLLEGIFFVLYAIAILIANAVVFVNILSSPHLIRQRRYLLMLNISTADLMFAVVICFVAKDHITRAPATSPLGWYIVILYGIYIWPSVISLNIVALHCSYIARMRSAKSSYQEKAWFTILLMAIPWIYALSVVVPVVVILSPFNEKTGHIAPRRDFPNTLLRWHLPNLVSVAAMIAALRVYADVRKKKAIYQECTESVRGEDTQGKAAHQEGVEGEAPKERTPAAECCEKNAAAGEEPQEGREPAPAFAPLTLSAPLLPPPTGASQRSSPFTSPAADAHLGESGLQGMSSKNVKSPAAVEFPDAEVVYTFLRTLLGIVPFYIRGIGVGGFGSVLALHLFRVLYPLRAVMTPWVWMVRPDYRGHFVSLLRHLCCSRA